MKDKGKKIIKFRVAGIAIDRQQVLIHRSEMNEYWSLPGGRVELMEKTSTALQREVQEETGLTLEIGRMVWVVENFFKKHGRQVHELGFYYLINLPGAPKGIFHGKERDSRLFYKWQDLNSLRDIILYPDFLKTGLIAIPDQLTHIIIHDIMLLMKGEL